MPEHHSWSDVAAQMRGHYTVLLTALFLVLALSPFVGGSVWGRWVMLIAFLFTMVSAVLACGRKRRALLFLIVLAVASLASSSAEAAMGLTHGRTVGDLLRFVFLGTVIWFILSDVLRSRRVTLNTVFGACCTYLLIGLMWAAVYSVLELNEPGSFGALAEQPRSARYGDGSIHSQLTYFSMITLTAVGYGDITPVTPPARTLAMIEGLIGQLYLAIIIARLVAMEITGRSRAPS